MRTLRTFARWLYWWSGACEDDPALAQALETTWWHGFGDQRLRDIANATPPKERA